MSKHSIQTLLATSTALAICLIANVGYAMAAEVPAANAAADDQSTSANQAGQANDRQSLTTSDIIVTGSRTAEAAPLTASLTTTQPQAAISREFIDNANAASDFNELIALTPGVSISGTGNGQGFSETKATIRGFQDGEYNVTYDSIPFADTNNPTHHSTSFFPATTIETIVVDRGPGNASQLGQATYGGNINMYSRAVSDKQGVMGEALLGNWNSFIGRAEVQTGKIDKWNGAKFTLSGQYLKSDGALTYSPVMSKNLFFKGVIPIGTSSKLTILSTWNRNYYYQSDVLKGTTCGVPTTGLVPGSATLKAENCAPTSNIGMYGLNYGLGGDPAKQDYWKYNRTDKTTDFSYLRLQSDLSSNLSLDNRVYMYGYTNNTMSGNTSTVVTGFSGAGTATSPYKAVTDASQIAGYNKLNKYRVIGYIGQADYTFGFGKIKAGGWYEHANTWRHTWDFSWTTGLPSYDQKFYSGAASTAGYPSINLANIKYEQNSSWDQFQLFGELELRPFSNLAITPGVKYVNFKRGVNALVNADSYRSPANSSATWTKTLPFGTINWQPRTNWSFYGQYAQGMYVPDLSSFYTPSYDAATAAQSATAAAAVNPQTSTNYQVGTVWHGRKVSIDLDGYIINVNNKIATATDTTAFSGTLANIGTVHYKGVEGQIAYMPIEGLTLFGNGSYNYAHSGTTNAQIAKAPFSTAAAGFIYKHKSLRVSFSQKFTGPQYATELFTVKASVNGVPTSVTQFTTTDGIRLYRISPYSTGEFAISQDIGEHFRIGATVSNVFNSRAITAISNGGTTLVGGKTYYAGADQFSFLPPRSFMVDVRVKY
ncbi:TonB-dependent receptor [Novosphingobium sp. KACC 22771]|uniref:TonB-dependent receptor n=1 Tax=Novosphingobium sp. KACC 22771 TaxID=3025670 RepID=UPI003FD41473